MLKPRPPSSTHQPYRKVPFYAYSSRNKRGNLPHPVVMRRHEQILNMYWEHRTQEEISVSLDISSDTVRRHLERARRDGDERAMRRHGQKRIMQAQARRQQILKLAAFGYTAAEIAKHVNAHVRLVQMRLKEAENASG